MSTDAITVRGIVVSSNRDIATVDADFGGTTRRVLARRCGRMQKHRIRVLPGDVVTVEVSAYDPTRGRIVERAR